MLHLPVENRKCLPHRERHISIEQIRPIWLWFNEKRPLEFFRLCSDSDLSDNAAPVVIQECLFGLVNGEDLGYGYLELPLLH